MDAKQLFVKFLNEQEILALASVDEDKEPWITNVYHSVDERGRIFFISSKDAAHSEHVSEHPRVAFAAASHKGDHQSRRGVQGVGMCKEAEGPDISLGTSMHNERFPEFAKELTQEYMRSNTDGARVYIIEPSYVKYWDDEAFGKEESKDIHF